MNHPTRHHTLAPAVLALVAALVASCVEDPPSGPAYQLAPATLLNRTHELIQLTAYPLRQTVDLGCEAILAQPELLLAEAFDLGNPLELALLSGEEVSVEPQAWAQGFYSGRNGCDAVLLRGGSLPDVVVVWRPRYGAVRYVRDADVPKRLEPGLLTVTIEADYTNTLEAQRHAWRHRPCPDARPGALQSCSAAELAEAARVPTGARYRWASRASEPLHAERRTTSTTDGPQCPTRALGRDLEWSSPPLTGDWEVIARATPRPGCATFTLEQRQEGLRATTDWEVCAHETILRPLWPEDGTRARVRFNDYSSPYGQHLRASIVGLSAEGVLVRPPLRMDLVRGTQAPQAPLIWLPMTNHASAPLCPATLSGACEVPLRAAPILVVPKNIQGLPATATPIGTPTTYPSQGNGVSLVVTRAGQAPWVDRGCAASVASGVLTAGSLYVEVAALSPE